MIDGGLFLLGAYLLCNTEKNNNKSVEPRKKLIFKEEMKIIKKMQKKTNDEIEEHIKLLSSIRKAMEDLR